MAPPLAVATKLTTRGESPASTEGPPETVSTVERPTATWTLNEVTAESPQGSVPLASIVYDPDELNQWTTVRPVAVVPSPKVQDTPPVPGAESVVVPDHSSPGDPTVGLPVPANESASDRGVNPPGSEA